MSYDIELKIFTGRKNEHTVWEMNQLSNVRPVLNELLECEDWAMKLDGKQAGIVHLITKAAISKLKYRPDLHDEFKLKYGTQLFVYAWEFLNAISEACRTHNLCIFYVN